MINEHGHREIFYITTGLLALAVTTGYFLVPHSALWWLAILPMLLVWFWGVWFFRDPERSCPQGEGLFISPADGVVADITPLGADSVLGTEGVQIGVFMNIFNVHVNRFPCDGVIQDITHQPGLYMDVRDPVAAEKNESSSMTLTHVHEGKEYRIIVRQIAGLLARRIVNFSKLGQTLKRGQRFGLIKFGSRVELLLPAELAGQICVEIGQPALAGVTILAKTEKAEA